jgi:hypothetical protein
MIKDAKPRRSESTSLFSIVNQWHFKRNLISVITTRRVCTCLCRYSFPMEIPLPLRTLPPRTVSRRCVLPHKKHEKLQQRLHVNCSPPGSAAFRPRVLFSCGGRVPRLL